jgi:hypothetical protein
MPKPSIGRIVRYVQFSGVIRPAIIVEVSLDREDVVNLRVFKGVRASEEPEQEAVLLCHRSDAKAHGTWHWPERE